MGVVMLLRNRLDWKREKWMYKEEVAMPTEMARCIATYVRDYLLNSMKIGKNIINDAYSPWI